jgi:hypothetical protein
MKKVLICLALVMLVIAGCKNGNKGKVNPTPVPTPNGAVQIEVEQGEVFSLLPIPCFAGNSSPPMFYWATTALDGSHIKVSIDQDDATGMRFLYDGDIITVQWCGTRAEVGTVDLIGDSPENMRVILNLYFEPKVLESGANIPTWPTPAPTATFPPIPGCNSNCSSDEDCKLLNSSLVCSEGFCRHPLSLESPYCESY